ncbi:MAG: GMC family oxidoreductase [Haloarculaceae archaeon]
MGEHEYVIVGAGSAGCVLANRLSAEHDVLVLEAGGPDEKREVSVPVAHPELLETDLDWGFRSTPQPALNDRRVYIAQGKTLGGSSSINAQMYFRGHPADYEAWTAAGNEGWDYDAAMEYYERLEDGEGHHYGTGGPQSVARQDDPHPISTAFVEAATECGLRRTPCFNAREIEGAGYIDVIQEGNQRHSAADAFLKPALDRPTLTAETGARVRRVTFDGDRATGVVYDQDGETKRATATGEVIVSAGAINSPRLLLLSGVGPADHLRDHGVEVQADRPGVGRNLHDHVVVWINYEAETSATYDDADSLVNLLKYVLLKRGPLMSNGTEAGGFWRSSPDLPAPDVQFVFAPAYVERNGLADPSGHGFSIGVGLVHPESRGRVALESGDPTDDPAIDPQYLASDDDLTALVDGVAKAREIAESDALDEYRAGRNWPRGDGEAAVRDHVRENAQSYFHLVGSCRMGDDETAVVDDRLRVHGVEGLRVVDASVMPTITRGNTHAPTLMIAERAADLIAGT